MIVGDILLPVIGIRCETTQLNGEIKVKFGWFGQYQKNGVETSGRKTQPADVFRGERLRLEGCWELGFASVSGGLEIGRVRVRSSRGTPMVRSLQTIFQSATAILQLFPLRHY